MRLECGYRVKNVGRGEAGIVMVVDVWSIVICFGQGQGRETAGEAKEVVKA